VPASPETVRYQAIRDYALVGDCHGSALIGRDGSVDWCCLGRFDASPVLWRLLDSEKGSSFHICPVRTCAVERGYEPDTNILRTVFTAQDGQVRVTDFMPVMRRAGVASDDYVTVDAPGWLVRVVEGLRGRTAVDVRFRQSTLDFDPDAARLEGSGGAAGPVVFHAGGPAAGAGELHMRIPVAAGERHVFVLAPASAAEQRPDGQAGKLLQATREFWRGWCGRCRYRGAHDDAVRRSALVLKALSFAPTGAIVAAPTTSLPEEPGGSRNWDYRFSWLRDSSFVLHALAALGFTGEARGYCEFLRLCCTKTLPSLQVLYGIRGETSLAERELPHLDGYQGARPVRVGNDAVHQKQLDIHGELADWAYLYHALGEPIDPTLEQLLRCTADHVTAHWHEPDQGIWEMRGAPRHHVHGKAMAWVALDRAVRLLGPDRAWEQARDAIAHDLSTRGVDARSGHFIQAFDYDDLDAALLLLPLLGLPVDQGVLARTVAAVEARLRVGDTVLRYLTDDGLPGGEGAFLICSFWLVDALLCVGRADEARALFERLLLKANDVGLYAEEIEPAGGAFLGNFPQAFTHLALINSAVHLQLYEAGGLPALAGTHADRVRRTLSMT
jgi:GH15 family glucan-1,4-alpha-glucosidase